MNHFGFLGPLLLLALAASAVGTARGVSGILRRRFASRLARTALLLVFACSTTAAMAGALALWWPFLSLLAVPWFLLLLGAGTVMVCLREPTGQHA
ncbi:hypothetical protein ACWDYJ_07135 [Streptomyces sp. NPDC003042]